METIVITGAGSGLGKELAIQFAEKGANLILVGRDKEKLQSVAAEIGETTVVYECDIQSYSSVEYTVSEILKNHAVTYLINNAGVGYFGNLSSLTIQEIDVMIDTNVKGTIYMTKALLPHLLSLPKAKIMNVISTAGLKGKVNESVYVAGKFAIRGFSESLVKELEETNISVTSVYMGGMDTPFWNNSDHIKDKTRLRSPKSVAEVILTEDDGRPEIMVP